MPFLCVTQDAGRLAIVALRLTDLNVFVAAKEHTDHKGSPLRSMRSFVAIPSPWLEVLDKKGGPEHPPGAALDFALTRG
jgi:hypothetical protein